MVEGGVCTPCAAPELVTKISARGHRGRAWPDKREEASWEAVAMSGEGPGGPLSGRGRAGHRAGAQEALRATRCSGVDSCVGRLSNR